MMVGWFRAVGCLFALCLTLTAQSCQETVAPVAEPYLLDIPVGLHANAQNIPANAQNIPADNPMTAANTELIWKPASDSGGVCPCPPDQDEWIRRRLVIDK
jgi:hypothetical protein